ncbi:DUF6233 domain-containing protein [Streptomyces sp. BBFR109]|uniref:DUF6233 domain-containing protein n=1 Tax=Streptomyces sp. BBFR109 TaxID=3448172 RepID=UPI003F76DF2E
MNDFGSRLNMLRFLERVQIADLERTRRWIAEEERKQSERQRGIDARPPTPDWVFERGLNRDSPPVAVHVGGCHMAGKRTKPISRDTALRALAEGVAACTHCRPDRELGFVDG